MEHINNIVHDSYYLINLFTKDNKKVTQLQIQKLMYFFEAYYMNEKNTEEPLYECNFNAWMFGPVAIPLYKEYKNFGEFGIELNDEKIRIGNSITNEKKKMLEEIYEVFGGLKPSELVKYTHMENSPWYNTWLANGKRIVSGKASYIDKIATKNWFKENFIENG